MSKIWDPPGPTKTGQRFKKAGKMTLQQQEYLLLHLFHVAYLVAKKRKPCTYYVDII